MKEHANLLHNMCVPSKSVIRYESMDFASKRRTKKYDRFMKQRIVAFKLKSRSLPGLSDELIRDVGADHGNDHIQTLVELINKRAQELPLPDGCLVIPYSTDHAQAWTDELSQLAVLCKSSSSVWLRAKETNLTAIEARQAVSLFLPNGLHGAY